LGAPLPTITRSFEDVKTAIRRGDVSPAVAKTEDFPNEVVLVTTKYDTLMVETEKMRERLKGDGRQVSGWMVIMAGTSKQDLADVDTRRS
jgi:hypothetical protein